jgi:cytochrome c peroxidase
MRLVERLPRAGFILISLFAAVIVSADATLGLPRTAPLPPRPESVALEQLGKRLFADKRLSADGSTSCTNCHIPEHHFTDGLSTARGLGGHSLARHTPSLLNVRYAQHLFWDGRATDLEAQIRTPLLGPFEHGFASEQAVLAAVRRDPEYASGFERLLGVAPKDLTLKDLGTAIAAYERTLLAGNSALDRYLFGHDRLAMTPAAVRGLDLFRGRARCATCHRIDAESALLNDGEFHASPLPLPDSTLSQLGKLTARVERLRKGGATDSLNALIASDSSIASLGRFAVTLDPRDIGLFKTPSLRNVASTGPYMHDGSVDSLEKAVDLELYSRTAQRYPLVITEDERADLIAFLHALSSRDQ